MSRYRQALKPAMTEHIRKLIDNNQNNPRTKVFFVVVVLRIERLWCDV